MSFQSDKIESGTPICDRLAPSSKQIYFGTIKIKSEIRGGRKAKILGGANFFQIQNQASKNLE